MGCVRPAMWRADVVASALLGAVLLAPSGDVAARDAASGKPAPALEARTLAGAHFSLAAQQGKVVIINVWATWCGPCRDEMPALDAFYKKHRAQGLELLALSADTASDVAQVREVMQAYSFPAAMISDTQMSGYGRMRQIPQTYVIDANGVLQRDGFVDKGVVDTALLERVVTPLLQAAGSSK